MNKVKNLYVKCKIRNSYNILNHQTPYTKIIGMTVLMMATGHQFKIHGMPQERGSLLVALDNQSKQCHCLATYSYHVVPLQDDMNSFIPKVKLS